jgi:hypothetical protein
MPSLLPLTTRNHHSLNQHNQTQPKKKKKKKKTKNFKLAIYATILLLQIKKA